MSQDLSYAVRSLRKNPAFAVTAILTLALAIGGNTAMFTVIHAVLLKPLEYREPEQLVRISGGASPVRFEEMKASAQSFSGLGAFTNEESLAMDGEAAAGVRVSGDFLQILGVNPVLGRRLLGDDEAMISAELWQRRFAGDKQVVGKAIHLGATAYSIAAVVPVQFQFPVRGIDVWLTKPEEWPLMAPKSRALSPFLTVFGRMKPGVAIAQANAEAAVIHQRYAKAHPAMLDAKAKSPVEVTLLKDQLVSQVRSMLWMLFGAVCFVLLIACANVANLLLARASARGREFAVRSALGAGRGRLIRQLLAESAVLALTGGLLGVALAAWGVHLIPGMTAFNLPRASEVHLDWMVMGFAAVLSLVTGLLFGLAPALSASRPDLVNVLRARVEPVRFRGWFNLRSVLVVAQVSLSVMLLIGGALLLKSVVHLRNVDVGFNPANLLTIRVPLPIARYDTDLKRTLFFEEAVRRVKAIPGVSDATAALFVPMTGFVGSPVQDAAKAPLKLNERLIATVLVVAPDYFRTLEIPLRRGRDFREQDNDEAHRVAIIDEPLARRFWPSYPAGQNPVGQRLLVGGVNAKPVEIVGIAAKVRQNLEDSAWPESVYVPLAGNSPASAMLAIRTLGAPERFTNAIRDQVRAIDRDQPVASVRTMDELVDEEVGQRRLIVALLGAFAGVALLLAVIGIYGVIAYSVIQRTHEIGIRMALGAGRGNVLRLVVNQGLGLALTGIAVGVAGALGLTRVLKHLLFGVSATDPGAFAGIALLFMVAALAASYIPAYRAARIDPIGALRVE